MIETVAIARAQALSAERPTPPRHEIPRPPRRPSRLAQRLRALLSRPSAPACCAGACP